MPRLRLKPDRHALVRGAAAIFSGLALSLAYAPFDLGPVALVALVPLLWVWRDARWWEAAVLGYLAGLAFFAVTLFWVVNIGVVAVPALVAGEALYWGVAGAVVGLMTRLRVRSPWTIAAAWVMLEAARGSFPLGGLAWNEVGMSLHDVSAARALATVGGVPLISFLVVLLNGFIADGLAAGRLLSAAGPEWRSRIRPLAAASLGVLFVAGATMTAVATRFRPTPTGELRYALIQGNDQDRRLTPEEIAAGYLTERHFAVADELDGDYDLIVFPESAFETDPETDPVLAARIAELAVRHDSSVLVNAITGPLDEQRNTNLFYDPDGQLVGTYSKQHLVPFGEFVPLGGWPRTVLPALAAQVPTDLIPGDESAVFPVGDHTIGTVICFESAFAPLVYDSVRNGAELIVVSTNNRSYRRSALSAQHLATSQMRAAETGRPVLHSSVSGITGVIDASGTVLQTNPFFENAVIEGTITTMTGETLAVRWGQWVSQLSIGIVGIALVTGGVRRRLTSRNTAASSSGAGE